MQKYCFLNSKPKSAMQRELTFDLRPPTHDLGQFLSLVSGGFEVIRRA